MGTLSVLEQRAGLCVEGVGVIVVVVTVGEKE